jgi:hypothetical protein
VLPNGLRLVCGGLALRANGKNIAVFSLRQRLGWHDVGAHGALRGGDDGPN